MRSTCVDCSAPATVTRPDHDPSATQDADRSGKLSRREMERLLLARETWMDAKEAVELMGSLTCFVDLDDGCSFDEFGEALTEIDHLLDAPSWQEKRWRDVELHEAKAPIRRMIMRFSPKKMAMARVRRRLEHRRLSTAPHSQYRAESKSAPSCSSTSVGGPAVVSRA